MRLRPVALFLLILTILPLASAQDAPAPSISVEASDETVVVSRDESTQTTFTVRFDSENNPFDTLTGRQVRVSGSELPAGWSVSLSETVFDMEPGTTATVIATFTLNAQAEQSEVPFTLTARLVPRGAEDTPVGGQVDPDAEGSADVQLKRDDPLTREVLEGLGGFVFIILGLLAILAVVIVILVARNNRQAVALHATVKEAQVAPGRSVAVPLRVENLTGDEDTIVFHVAPVPAGWAASLPVPDLALDGRRTEELHLVVTSPPNAQPGASARVGVSAHSAQNPKRVAEAVVDVKVGDTDARKAAGDTTFADEKDKE